MRIAITLLTSLFMLSGCAFGAANANVAPAPTYDPALPFPVPASCPQPSYLNVSILPERMRQTTMFWIGSDTLAVGHIRGTVWRSGENAVAWWSADGEPTIEMNLLEGKTAPPSVTFQRAALPLYPSVLVLPQNGCWEIIATAGAQRLRFLMYVYPARFVP